MPSTLNYKGVLKYQLINNGKVHNAKEWMGQKQISVKKDCLACTKP